ncbi:hypothetical protein Hypma_001841 [Hypsizygus marmoreus]|uniref:Uncharacterized protein n=1 Tax=Hypsizygus marmoreus TaxID=39966 RepID=A0A369J5G9_HYPMA|nr:hypothetical protein Hypma_001841 [Hypsizygus marmoreus]
MHIATCTTVSVPHKESLFQLEFSTTLIVLMSIVGTSQDQPAHESGTRRELPRLTIPVGLAPPKEKKSGFRHGLTAACAILPQFPTLPDYFKPSVMRPRGWRPPKLHYGFFIDEKELGDIATKRGVVDYWEPSPFPLPGGIMHHPSDTAIEVGEHIKKELGASSMNTLKWEYILHIYDPTVDATRVGLYVLALGCNWTKDGQIPNDEDIKKVLEFFDRPQDTHIVWHVDASEALWTPL